MSVTVHLDEQAAIVYMEYSGYILADEMSRARKSIMEHLETSQQPLRLVANWKHAANHPLRYSMKSEILAMVRHPNMGTIAVVGINPVLNFWLEFYARQTALYYVICDTVEDAVQVLQAMDRRSVILPASLSL